MDRDDIGGDFESIDYYSDPVGSETHILGQNESGHGQIDFDHGSSSAAGVGVDLDMDLGLDDQMNLVYSPQLEEVTETLRWVFWLHAYGFACLFFFLAFYSFFSILNLRSQLSTRPYMTTINSFLCLLGASRAAVLFIDPYGLQHRMPVLIGSLLWDFGFPSLISSFSLIQIAFLQLTQVDVGPETFRKKTCLSVVITMHFMTVIISAIYTTLSPDLMLGKLMTQLLFAIWGFVLCGSFLVAGKRVLRILGSGSGGSTTTIGSANDKGIANLFGMGMLAPGGGQNLASSLTAALAPTLLQATSSGGPGGGGPSNKEKDKDTPKIKITDEHDRTVSVASASDSSRLNDIPEVPEGSGSQSTPMPIIPPTSPRSSFSGPGGSGDPGGPSGSGYVRPPSPVLPRRKSSGPGLRTSTPRRLSWNRRDSGGGELLATTPTDREKETRKKSLTWSEVENVDRISCATDKRRGSRKSIDGGSANANADPNPERNGGTETLLSTAVGGPDYTLQSILSHIAYVNQTALDYRLSRKLSRTNQVHKVVKYTSVTAALGFIICIGELIRLISPYGMLASSKEHPGVWPWFILNTLCRITEFAMGATVANITKQPASRPHHYAYSIRHKHHRESLYL